MDNSLGHCRIFEILLDWSITWKNVVKHSQRENASFDSVRRRVYRSTLGGALEAFLEQLLASQVYCTSLVSVTVALSE